MSLTTPQASSQARKTSISPTPSFLTGREVTLAQGCFLRAMRQLSREVMACQLIFACSRTSSLISTTWRQEWMRMILAGTWAIRLWRRVKKDATWVWSLTSQTWLAPSPSTSLPILSITSSNTMKTLAHPPSVPIWIKSTLASSHSNSLFGERKVKESSSTRTS